jgi:RHS repeat-associated protein
MLKHNLHGWLYDNMGRLTRESYDSSDDSLDFLTDYVFDLVGNRLEKQTDTDPTFTGDPTFDDSVTYTYDDNDRLLTETKNAPGMADDRHTVYQYDATQQTQKTVHEGLDDQGTVVEDTSYGYNLQGRMSTVTLDSDGDGVPETQLEYEYDDSGIRVAQEKRVDTDSDGDFTDETPERTEYLVDHHNHTGYAQVLEERVDGQLSKSYTLGLDVLAQALALNELHHFLYDGHGSTRLLVDPTGQPLTTEIYRYDAYGVPIGFVAASALTTLLYSGEQTDPLTALQYLRARYYDLATGRFNRLDPFAGKVQDPQSLHKYLYTHGDAINYVDPSGMMDFSLSSMMLGTTIVAAIAGMYVGAVSDSSGAWWEGLLPGWGSGRGLGKAIRNGDPVGISAGVFFLTLDILSFGGASWAAKSFKTGPKLARGIPKSQVDDLFRQLISVVDKPTFRENIRMVGFRVDDLPVLVRRLRDYLDAGKLGFSRLPWVNWVDDTVMAMSRRAMGSWRTIAHELTHVLDDIANPGLLRTPVKFEKFWTIVSAEYKAFAVQTGSKMIGGGAGFFQTLALTAPGTILFPFREMIYAVEKYWLPEPFQLP